MFASILRSHRRMIALYIAIGIASAAAASLSVVFFQRLMDQLTARAAMTTVLPLLLAYGLIAACEYIFSYLGEYPYNKLHHGIYQTIKQSALKKMARIDYTAYQDLGTGRLVQIVENGAAAGRDILFEFYLRIAAYLLPGAILSVAFMGLYNWRIMLAALMGYVLVFLITKLLLKRLYSIKEKTLVSEEWLSKTYVRAFMELLVFRVNRRWKRELERIEEESRSVVSAHTRIKLVHEFFFTAFTLIVLVIKVILVAASVFMISEGTLSIGVLLALLTLIDRIYTPIAIFNVIYVDYKLNRVAWDRFMRFENAPDDPNLGSGRPFTLRSGEIRFDSISFAYQGAELLRDLTLVIPAHSTTALVGPSGAGKSTIAKLALGLIKPTSGRVLVDGQPLDEIELNSYYQHIAYISQDAPVFDGTLRENIAFGAADDEALMRAIEKARLGELVASLEKGLDAEIGEHGVKLSGGEKQRLAFARVFFHQPSIVILDEPTSALDLHTERQVIAEMTAALAGKTILSIAHRLSTVRDADAIAVLREGTICELGAHDALMAADGTYASLMRAGERRNAGD